MELTAEAEVSSLPYLKPRSIKALKKLNLLTLSDLLHHYPFRYEDYRKIRKISELVFGETVTVRGFLKEIKNLYTRSRKTIQKGKLRDATGEINLIWFNQPYLVKILGEGTELSLAGRVDIFSGRLAFVSPDYELLTTHNQLLTTRLHTGRLVPVYPETAGISSKWLRAKIDYLLKTNLEINDPLSLKIRREENLVDLPSALRKIHFPENDAEIEQAKKRLSFDEILNNQLRSQIIKRSWRTKRAAVMISASELKPKIDLFLSRLPFHLTNDQERAKSVILSDLGQNEPMNRLLQGEVGSGKTVVAAIAAYAVSLQGYKTVYMAPTEILARQHFQTFQKLFNKDGIEIELVTSSTRQNSKSQILPPRRGSSQAGNLSSKIIVGTHALLYQLKKIEKIGLVVIDEQHKFGVGQRAELLSLVSKDPNQSPHLLTMTATPIPRTLALAYFSDLDFSTIQEMPENRKKVITRYVPPAKREKAFEWVKRNLQKEGTQAYIVCPFIEESERETLSSVRAATKEFRHLESFFSPLKSALLHGRLKNQEKERILLSFSRGDIDLLIATPIVEVGLDNPRATIILIETAERFGLASLHQLRGRVGRGEKKSYCLLFSENESPEIVTRLKILEKNSSGLQLAEMDLKKRGMGSFFGKDQSGFSTTKIADPVDTELIGKAKKWADYLLRNEPLEKLPSGLTSQIRNVHLD